MLLLQASSTEGTGTAAASTPAALQQGGGACPGAAADVDDAEPSLQTLQRVEQLVQELTQAGGLQLISGATA
jgi:hypothetical protein